MLSIDEAIENLKYDIEIDMYIRDIAPQLAEWLEELKAIKEMDLDIPQHFTKEQSDWIKAYCIRRNIEFYNKAIDDFAEKLKSECREHYIDCDPYFGGITDSILYEDDIEEMAEQLKACEENE